MSKIYLTRIVNIALIAVLLLLTAPQFSLAEADDSSTVKVGYYENEVFQEGASEGTIKTGYAYEYYRKLSEYTGWKYEYVYGDYGELYKKLLAGEIDLLAGLAYKEEREGLIGYPDLPMGNETYNLVRHNTDGDITPDPATLSGKTIGVLDSAMVAVLDEYLKTQDVTADVVTFSDYETLFKAFDEGAVDVLAAEGDGAYGRKDADVIGSFGASDYYLCVNIKREDLLAQLNEGQTELFAEEPGYLTSLNEKYYKNSVAAKILTQEEAEWVDSHDTLRVGYMNNYLPYSNTDEHGEPEGMVSELFSAMMNALGEEDIEITFKGYDSYKQMIADMGTEDIDVAFPVGGGLYFSEENGLYQSNPVVTAAMQLVYEGDYSDELTESFAVNENNLMQYYYVRTHFPDSKIDLYPSIDDCLDAVKAGKAGCTTLNGLRANDILRNSKYNDLSLKQLVYNDDRCFGIQIGNEGLLKLLNHGLKLLGDEHALSLAYKYTDGLYKYTAIDMIREHRGILAALAAAIVALIVFFLMRDARVAKKNQAALAEALEAAENASRAKTTFLNNMSHDIRTPMNAIVGFSALAASHIDDKEQVMAYLEKISVSSQHLLSLINDVLDMSRIESGKMNIEESDTDLSELIEDLATIVRSDAAAKDIELSVDTSGIEHTMIVTDSLRLNQVLLNILSNAIKFTPDGGKINLAVSETQSGEEEISDYEFRIEDNGIGMSDEFKAVIFEAFTRERTSTVSGIQGTGLGMAITKNIVDMLGGTISVDSKAGEGSVFTVIIPCRHGSAAISDSGTQVEANFADKRILLAEDNEMNQMIAVAILEDAGFAVDIANDGTEAVAKIQESAAGSYDLILMDIQMPQMDGYEATEHIRALDDSEKAAIPIIAVTANAFEEDKKLAMESGMNGHLAKPYNISDMIETISKVLSEQQR